jgi:hypothetical protein
LAATPNLEENIKKMWGTGLLDTFALSTERLEDVCKRDADLMRHAARWLCASGRDPRPFLRSLTDQTTEFVGKEHWRKKGTE